MANTDIPSGSSQAVTKYGVGLFNACMQRLTTLGKMAGSFPKIKDVENRFRVQSSSDMPIVRCMDLTKTAGETINFDLVNPVNGKPVMGDAIAEGTGEAMTFAQDSLKINQTRKPISAGGQMAQQRTVHELQRLARGQAENYMNRLTDQLELIHLAGSRGFNNDIEWVVPLASDADFTSICVNSIKAPTYNRHFMSTSSGIEHIQAGGNEITIASTDIMNTTVLDGLSAYVDEMTLPPPPIKLPGDEAAADDPIRLLLVSPQGYKQILQSTNFRTFQSNALARASMAKGHPLFKGEAGLWNGILIRKMNKPIRFYTGNALNWCASATSTTETSTDLVPAAFSTSYAVDRSLLVGGQALAEAFGKTKQTGVPYFWSEKYLDHDNRFEVLVGEIAGRSKIRFLINHGTQSEYTDFGVMAIDHAVPLV